MKRKEAIRSAYRLTGSSSFYDGMMTCSTLPGRLVCRLVWDMDKQMCSEYQEKALSGIPEDFSGRLLEVPVGTGILTMPLYQTLPKAEVTCLDYSPDMMAQAKERRTGWDCRTSRSGRGMWARFRLRTAALTRYSRSMASTPSPTRRRPTARPSGCCAPAERSAAAFTCRARAGGQTGSSGAHMNR